MTTGEIVITAYITLLTAGLGSLFWRQLTEIRAKMAALRAELREEIGEVRRELHGEIASVRSELAGLRSDLTQVALAVGARRPRASEG